MSELKPCPFCGGEAKVSMRGFKNYMVQCLDQGCCSSTMRFWQTEQQAIDAWNRRPEPKAVIPYKRFPGIGRCPTCKQDLCMDDEKLHYCPTCGTPLITPGGDRP